MILVILACLFVCLRVIYFTLLRKEVDKEEKEIFFSTCGAIFWFGSLFTIAYFLQGFFINHKFLATIILIVSFPITLIISEKLFFKRGAKDD